MIRSVDTFPSEQCCSQDQSLLLGAISGGEVNFGAITIISSSSCLDQRKVERSVRG